MLISSLRASAVGKFEVPLMGFNSFPNIINLILFRFKEFVTEFFSFFYTSVESKLV